MDDKDKIIEILREENCLLKVRILELERCLGMDSSTSSKPPSSDGLGKKPFRSALSSRGSNKSRGGQKGHKGKTMELVESPDQVIIHSVAIYSSCQADLSQVQANDVVKRQVFDVEICRYVTEHQGEVKTCLCGACTMGSFPANVKAPVQIGDTVKGIALYLSQQFIPKDRLSEVMQDLFSIPVSDTTLLKHEAQLAQNLDVFHEEALAYLREVDAKHADETGMRVGGKTEWIHVLSDHRVTYLWHSRGRKCLLSGLSGVLVHDHYSSYLQLGKVSHAFCNAHHLRELKALMTYEKEEWAGQMQILLKAMCHAKNQNDLTPQKIAFFRRIYDKILERGLSYHESLEPLKLATKPPPTGHQKRGRIKRRVGHNLLMRLLGFKEGVLLFLKNPKVPFTNNQAEQDLRMVKIKQKVSGCFRTAFGVKNFTIIRSFVGTVKKNGLNVLDAIKMAMTKPLHLSDILPPTYKTGLPALFIP